MAAVLVGTYSRPGDTILSVGEDPVLAGVAGAVGRTYRAVGSPDALGTLEYQAGRIAMIILSWPIQSGDPTAMFHACRNLMRADGYTIVMLTNRNPGSTYAEQSFALIPAAGRAGLSRVQHIVVTTAEDDPTIDTDLLVFVMARSQ